MNRRVISILALSLLVLSAGRASAASIIYSQPANFPEGTELASQDDPGGLGAFATVYDNFTLGFDAEVTDVHWTGGYFNPGTAAFPTNFTIGFYADSAGQPGTSLLSQTFGGSANQTFLGNEAFGPVYTYNLILPTSFLATAGTKYWLSIVPVLSPVQPQWGWYSSAVGDGVGYQDFFGFPRTLTGTDFAFDLTGNSEVPEPMTLTLLGTGLVGLVGRRAQQRRKAKQRS